MTKEQVIAAARSLSADDQAYIVAALDAAEVTVDQTATVLDADGWSPSVPPELRAELTRRMAAYDADPFRGIALEQFRARLAAG